MSSTEGPSNSMATLLASLPAHAACTLASICLLVVVDHWMIKPFITPKIANKKDLSSARWFFIHSFANLLVVLTGLPALMVVATDPIHAVDSRVYFDTSFFGNASSWPLTFVNAVHIYHMVGGFQLTSGDYFHHLLFIPFLGFPGQVLLWGAVEPAGTVFISGLPGGISYLMLGMQKLNMMPSIVEKRVTANLNAWVRTPGILINSFIVYQAMLYGNHTLPLWAPFLHVVLPPYNGIYYCKQAIANYTVHFLNGIISQDETIRAKLFNADNKVRPPTGLRKDILCSWREAIAVPQRGS